MSFFGFGKKKEEQKKPCCCGGSCTPEVMQAAEAEKKESGIKILGGGCAKCNALEAATVDALRELGMDTTIDHVRDFEKIAAYGDDHPRFGGGRSGGVLWQGAEKG